MVSAPGAREHEPDHRTGDVVGSVRAVLGGHGGDGHAAPPLDSTSTDDHGSSPVALPPSRSAPAAVVSTRPRARQELPSRRVEVVGVMVVGEQHHVDGADGVGRDRRAR